MSSLSIPKIQLGKSGYAQTKINLNHDVSTSTDWGFVQPVMVKKMVKGSTLHLNALRSVVRVSPLVKPTFGSASWKTYHAFVPIADLLPSYEYFLSGKPYYVASQNNNYVPTQMPWIYVADLTKILLGLSNKFVVLVKDGVNYKSIRSYTSAQITGIVSAFITHMNLSNGQESGISATDRVNLADSDITPDSADFVFRDTVTYSNVDYDICVLFRLNRNCRNVRKVLLGCGYQLDPNLTREVCILPLMAYYRVWFNIFAPKRDLAWTGTNAFHLLDYIRENAITNVVTNNTSRQFFKSFMVDVASCFYTDDTDFISAHIPTPSVGRTIDDNGFARGLGSNSPSQLSVSNIVSVTPAGQQPYIASSTAFTSSALRLLDKLTKAVNKDSQIAQRVDTWLMAHGFGKSLTDVDPYAIGSDSVPINIQSVMSTADTEEAGLGDFAGTAVGFKDNSEYPNFSYTAPNPGFWITLGCCVPDTGWFQGLAPDTGVLDFRRYDEYFPEYDALGLEISNKDQVVCDGSVCQLNPTGSAPVPFGFIPRSSRHKVIQNVVNGDLSLRSQRNDALPYTLDRFITPSSIRAEVASGTGESTLYGISWIDQEVPIASTVYRYVGRDQFMGNYDRIFQIYQDTLSRSQTYDYNYFPMPDHFIVHNYFDCTYMAPVLSMKESFDTDSFDSNTMDVAKA